MKRALPQQIELIATIVESVSEGYIAFDQEWHYIYINIGAERVIGVKREELLGKLIWDVFPEVRESPFFQKMRDAMETGVSARLEDYSPLLKKWIEMAIYTSNVGIVIYFVDISARKQLEEALIDTHKRIEEALYYANKRITNILESITDGFISLDSRWRYTYVNKEAEQILGKSMSDLLGRSIWEVFPELKDSLYEETFRQAVEEEKPLVFEAFAADEHKWYENRVYPAEGGGLSAYFHDITARLELETRKDDFISMASHELKTPLTSIKAFTQILERFFEDVEIKEPLIYLKKMEAQINRLNRLVTQLLDVSKIGQGKLEFAIEHFDFDILIAEVVENLQQISKRHQLVLEGKVGQEMIGDRDRLGQVLINLLTNAMKYSPEAERVDIRVACEDQNVQVRVRDYGVGVPTIHQERIFERFYRVSNEKDRTFPGLGIGLHIAYVIVQRHGGRMWVESVEGEGSTFLVVLPLQEAERLL